MPYSMRSGNVFVSMLMAERQLNPISVRTIVRRGDLRSVPLLQLWQGASEKRVAIAVCPDGARSTRLQTCNAASAVTKSRDPIVRRSVVLHVAQPRKP